MPYSFGLSRNVATILMLSPSFGFLGKFSVKNAFSRFSAMARMLLRLLSSATERKSLEWEMFFVYF